VWKTKGLDTLLHALKSIAVLHPTVSLEVLGSDSRDPELLGMISDLGLMNRVYLLGKVSREQVARSLWHADIFVLPSRREGLGVAVLEAMAAGVPVVATRVGGIPEIVRSDAEGILVAPGDPRGLAVALEMLIKDQGRRATLARAGRHRADSFSVDAMVQNVRLVYEQISVLPYRTMS
jgi:glycosyltransferase involved in cell wall biosynthesis